MSNLMSASRCLGLAAALWASHAALAPASPLAAQIPQTFTNLHYFPEDISRGELIGYMREFSFALNVRCQYCHVGGDGVSFEGVDFASDESEAKRTARHMLEMVQDINRTVADIPDVAATPVRVECQTCHHGLSRPEMIDDIMTDIIAASGVEEAIARYRELREENYGGWSYDFGEWAMLDLANQYREDPETVVALLRMTSEFHGESVSVWVALGGAEEQTGNTEGATSAYERALELAPDEPRILDALARLRGGG